MDEVLIPYGDDASETATLLLGAAEEIDGVEAWQVRNQPDDGGFRVPPEVAKKAGLKPVDTEAVEEERQEEARKALAEQEDQTGPGDDEKPKRQPRKRAAKKAPAKKTASKE